MVGKFELVIWEFEPCIWSEGDSLTASLGSHGFHTPYNLRETHQSDVSDWAIFVSLTVNVGNKVLTISHTILLVTSVLSNMKLTADSLFD